MNKEILDKIKTAKESLGKRNKKVTDEITKCKELGFTVQEKVLWEQRREILSTWDLLIDFEKVLNKNE